MRTHRMEQQEQELLYHAWQQDGTKPEWRVEAGREIRRRERLPQGRPEGHTALCWMVRGIDADSTQPAKGHGVGGQSERLRQERPERRTARANRRAPGGHHAKNAKTWHGLAPSALRCCGELIC
ncbi:hypothetical protein CCMA1212_002125 [Trichoderma ghanense]|uniref:Uncharacterized protein n=1 Tax=Trichoderma ghanense TaxID=65468 RepID=A0ABY2HFM6_9HYPO